MTIFLNHSFMNGIRPFFNKESMRKDNSMKHQESKKTSKMIRNTKTIFCRICSLLILFQIFGAAHCLKVLESCFCVFISPKTDYIILSRNFTCSCFPLLLQPFLTNNKNHTMICYADIRGRKHGETD